MVFLAEQNDKSFKDFDSYDISLGELLRGERATLGKTREQVQKELKIKAEFIEAIERCQLSGVDNRSFIAGYVRTYARYLGMDPEYVYERFCQESGFLSSDVNPFSTNKKKSTTKKINKLPISDNFWEPGKLGAEQDTKKAIFANHLYKMAPMISLLLVLFGVGYWATTIITDLQRLEIVPIEQEPYKSVDLLSEIMGQGKELTNAENYLKSVEANNELGKDNFLHNYYASQEELFPIVESRDSPIAKIDPSTHGIFLEGSEGSGLVEIDDSLEGAVSTAALYDYEPLVVITPKAPILKLITLERAWVRLRDERGDIYLERNFKAGEKFVIPENLFAGSLRAGNATKVYFELDGEIFGPLSTSNSVVKDFNLDPLQIGKDLALMTKETDLFKSFEDHKSQGLSTAKRNNE